MRHVPPPNALRPQRRRRPKHGTNRDFLTQLAAFCCGTQVVADFSAWLVASGSSWYKRLPTTTNRGLSCSACATCFDDGDRDDLTELFRWLCPSDLRTPLPVCTIPGDLLASWLLYPGFSPRRSHRSLCDGTSQGTSLWPVIIHWRVVACHFIRSVGTS